MDLNAFARDMLRAEGGNANMDAVLAALEGDKDAVIQALWRGRSVAAQDRETLRKGIADMLEMPIGCFMNDGWQKTILENLNEYAEDAEGRRERMDILRHFICRDLFDLTPDDWDGREHDLADRLKALNDVKESTEAERDTLRDGIARVLGVNPGEFCGYEHWDKDLVAHLHAHAEKIAKENDDLQHSYSVFHQQIVTALGGGVATEEQILQAIRAPLAAPASDPRVTALEAEIDALKEQAAVSAITAAAREAPIANGLREQIATLRSIIFAHETRELLLKADLRRAQEALSAAGQPLPEEASARSRVPAVSDLAGGAASPPVTPPPLGRVVRRTAYADGSLSLSLV